MPFDTVWDSAWGDAGGGWADAMPYVGAIGGFLGGLGQNFAARRNHHDDVEQSNLDRELARARLEFEQSMANPFRHQLNQARSVNVLEGMGNSSYRSPTVTPHGAYGGSMPQIDGGFSFESGPDGPAAARALQSTVMRGMTRPEDRNGGIDLVSLLAGNGGDLWNDDDVRSAVPRGSTGARQSDGSLRYGRGYTRG